MKKYELSSGKKFWSKFGWWGKNLGSRELYTPVEAGLEKLGIRGIQDTRQFAFS